MHILAADSLDIDETEQAIDLQQSGGDIVILSAAETDLATLSQAASAILSGSSYPTIRLANLMLLLHPYSVDLYIEKTLSAAQVIVVRLLGGRSYWPYGVDALLTLQKSINTCDVGTAKVIFIPGDDQPDPELRRLSNVSDEDYQAIMAYFHAGGQSNMAELMTYLSYHLLNKPKSDVNKARPDGWEASQPLPPRPLPRAGIYTPPLVKEIDIQNRPSDQCSVAIIFYRALVQSGQTQAIDTLVAELNQQGLYAIPIFIHSLKEEACATIVEHLLNQWNVRLVLNATGFALSQPNQPYSKGLMDQGKRPVLQFVLSSENYELWQEKSQGLSPRALAMYAMLPELDGRILTRAIAFRGQKKRDPLTECDLTQPFVAKDRCSFLAKQAHAWVKLQQTTRSDKKIAICLSNYPLRDGRLANGVGLDTPQSTLDLLHHLRQEGFDIPDVPYTTAQSLIEELQKGPTNANPKREARYFLTKQDYDHAFSAMPTKLQQQIIEKWGGIEDDPFYQLENKSFGLPVMVIGHIALTLQVARGYQIDPEKTYHDPSLLPPHGYFALYFWLRFIHKTDALIHMGKHGTLEWLPGKATALSSMCLPEAVLGAMPVIYPFIVNDPGEGTQAKRRSSAVIIDHLPPPLARAESHSIHQLLERMIDEYAGADLARRKLLGRDIIDCVATNGLDQDCGLDLEDDLEAQLKSIDSFLCTIKELQIRDGLHILGCSPKGELQISTLMALVRYPRHSGQKQDMSLLHAIAVDLALDDQFDPLDFNFYAEPWSGLRPEILQTLSDDLWRSYGDTVERLELLGLKLIEEAIQQKNSSSENKTKFMEYLPQDGHSSQVMIELVDHISPLLNQSGKNEFNAIVKALDGQFIAPGPSGAPSTGRLDILPTGRNFYSVDSRKMPTPTAWRLGFKSAQMLVEAYTQEHGHAPQQIALSVWGTSNMRTGGDDIAQALALIGVQPQWESQSGRMIGFDVLSTSMLDRPRVDVMLRISGFFRDAFPQLITLVHQAIKTVAQLDEPFTQNPIRERFQKNLQYLNDETPHLSQAQKEDLAVSAIFGAKPGSYGAGLQSLMNEGHWQDDSDLAEAFIAWGGYLYGPEASIDASPADVSPADIPLTNAQVENGMAAHDLFKSRLKNIEAVIHNQDNREHDLLDSDDYYQFQGGLMTATRHLSGKNPDGWFNDHSRSEYPMIKPLEYEIAKVVRGRVTNPKWIEGVMRHGYKGAFEMAASVDYLFAYAATTHAVGHHHFDMVYDSYIDNPTVREFLKNHNPDALNSILERLQEAIDRNLWKPRRNHLVLSDIL